MEFDLDGHSENEIPLGQPHPEQRAGNNEEIEPNQEVQEDRVEVLRPWLHESERRLGRLHPEVTRIRELLRKATEKNDRQKPPEDKLQSLKDKIRNQEERMKDSLYFLELKEGHVKKAIEERDAQRRDYEEAKAELESSKTKKQELLEAIAKDNQAHTGDNANAPTMESIAETLKVLAMRWPRNMAPPVKPMVDEFAQHLMRIIAVMEEAAQKEKAEAADTTAGSDVEMEAKTTITRTKKVSKQQANEKNIKKATGGLEDTGASSSLQPATSALTTPTTTPRARKAPEPVGGSDNPMALKTRRGDEQGGVLVTNQGHGHDNAAVDRNEPCCP